MAWETEVTNSDSGGLQIDNWDRVKADIIAKLNVVGEFEKLGLRFSKPEADKRGWRQCHAKGRIVDQDTPSAGVHLATAKYHDFSSGEKSLSLFDFALKYGHFDRIIDVFKHYAAVAGIPLGKPAMSTNGRMRDGFFDYVDASGNVRYRVFRYINNTTGKKTFSQHPPDGKGGWKFGPEPMKGVDPLPYRLRDLLASDPETRTVWVTEGERKADRLAASGLVAISSHGGCGQFSYTWTKFDRLWFKGRHLVLLPDNSHDGRVFMGKVGEWLTQAGAASVKIVNLPDLTRDADIIDWLDQGGTIDDLHELAHQTEEWQPGQSIPEDIEHHPQPDPAPPNEPRAVAVTVCLGDVQPVDVQWLIPDKVPIGKLTLLAGQPGLGKSFLTIDLIARITRGSEVPGQSEGLCVPDGSVVILSAEDDLADTIRPRLDAAGADVSRVHALTTLRMPDGRLAPFDLTYIPQLEDVFRSLEDGLLLVIDPITSYIGSATDDHRNSQLRTVMEPLAEMAARLGIAILVITHLNKGVTSDAINRVTGSMAYVALARAAWLLIRDADDFGRRLFLSIKNNLAPEPWGLAFRIIDGKIVWEDGPIQMTANDALRQSSQREKGEEQQAPDRQQQVDDFLKETLAGVADVPSETVFARGRAKGFSRKALFESKERLGVKARPGGFQGKWTWSLEEDAQDLGAEKPFDPDCTY